MAYLGLALFAEGLSDHRFLQPALRRLSESICAQLGRAPIEVGDVMFLTSPPRSRGESRAVRIRAAAEECADGWHVLFIHADGAGDPDRARLERVQPACHAIDECERLRTGRTIAVVPVRETEAWCLADGDALRRAFGSTASDNLLGVPTRPREVEDIADPKRVLDSALVAARGGQGRRRRRPPVAGFYEIIGEVVSLDVLNRVPAFRQLRDDLTRALRDLGILN